LKTHRYVGYAIAGSRTVIGGLEDADGIRIGKYILSYTQKNIIIHSFIY